MTQFCMWLRHAGRISACCALFAFAGFANGQLAPVNDAQIGSDNGQTLEQQPKDYQLVTLPRADAEAAERFAMGAVCPETSCDASGLCCVTQNAATADNVGQVACGAAGLTTANAYARCFDLDGTEGIVGEALTVKSVRFAVEQMDTTTGPKPLDINIYQQGGCPPVMAIAGAPLATETIMVDETDEGNWIEVPITAMPVIVANRALIVEISAPVDGTDPATAYAFRPRANMDGACVDSYLAATDCGFDDWTSVTDVGFPDSQTVMLVTGTIQMGTASVCGDGVVEGCEECEPGIAPPGTCDPTTCMNLSTGACCDGTAPFTCNGDITEINCTDNFPGAVWLGPGSSCNDCGDLACGDGAGDCFDPAGNGSPGCDFEACCAQVCDSVPECCTVEWDFLCAEIANNECPPFPPEHCQTADQAGHDGTLAATSDANPALIVADNFIPVENGFISELRWWGVYVDFSLPADCGPGAVADSFTVTIYDDGGGFPGTVISSQLATITLKEATGNVLTSGIGDIAEFVYDATLTMPVEVFGGTCFWISIQNNTGVSNCFWLWSTAPPGDEYSVQDDLSDGTGFGTEDSNFYDLAWCVSLEIFQQPEFGDPSPCEVAPTPCVLAVDPDAIDENEPCGDDLNGGCNAGGTPADFTPLTIGAKHKGTVWADGGTRDTDWYSASIPQAEFDSVDADGDGAILVCYDVNSEVRAASFFLDDDGQDCVLDGPDDFFGGAASASFCTDIAPSAVALFDVLPEEFPIPFYQFVSTGNSAGGGVFDGFPCDGPFGNDYELCVQLADATGIDTDGDGIFDDFDGMCPEPGTCVAGPGCPPCPDFDGDNDVDAGDLAILLGAWGNPGCSGMLPCCADRDDDGDVDAADLAQLLGAWGLCP